MNPADVLTEHLDRLDPINADWNRLQAEKILADPQAHIDALVEAGVLKWYSDPPFGVPLLTVVQPEPPRCTAWVEIGHGVQRCTRDQHDEGGHTTRPQDGGVNFNTPDVDWYTG